MTIERILLAICSLGSVGTLALVLRLGIQYGRDGHRLSTLENKVHEVDTNVRAILGNGHPGPFVPREIFESVAKEVRDHRDQLRMLQFELGRKNS